MNIHPGAFVTASAGREKGKCFIVLSVENQFLYLCDGKNRKVNNPKKKKIKHVAFAGDCEGFCADSITDRAVRKALSAFKGNVTAEMETE